MSQMVHYLWGSLFQSTYNLVVCSQDIAAEAVKKKRRTTKKPYSRSIVGATLEVIQKRRAEKPEVRDAAREAALRYTFTFNSFMACEMGGIIHGFHIVRW